MLLHNIFNDFHTILKFDPKVQNTSNLVDYVKVIAKYSQMIKTTQHTSCMQNLNNSLQI